MPKMVFINLPITDLARSIAFYETLGGTKNPKFSDESSACMVFSETIHVMLLTHDKYRIFTSRPIADARATSSALIALTVDSRDEVNATIDLAVAAGGQADPNPDRTTASCLAARCRTRTVTYGRFFGWIPQQQVALSARWEQTAWRCALCGSWMSARLNDLKGEVTWQL